MVGQGALTPRTTVILHVAARAGIGRGQDTEAVMFEDKTRVLLILRQDVLDRARVLAGKATTALKLPVSLQIVLRALIEEGLKRDDHPALLANVEAQAKAVRMIRSAAGGRRRTAGEPRAASSRTARGLSARGPGRRPKRRAERFLDDGASDMWRRR
jgi:hypothetical protein